MTQGNPFADEAAGIAGTAVGDHFSVYHAEDEDGAYASVYEHAAGNVADLKYKPADARQVAIANRFVRDAKLGYTGSIDVTSYTRAESARAWSGASNFCLWEVAAPTLEFRDLQFIKLVVNYVSANDHLRLTIGFRPADSAFDGPMNLINLVAWCDLIITGA